MTILQGQHSVLENTSFAMHIPQYSHLIALTVKGMFCRYQIMLDKKLNVDSTPTAINSVEYAL